MAQTLESFIREADSVFLGRYVSTQYQQGAPTTRPIEILAQYLVAEMHDLYDPTSSDRQNLGRFISTLEFASARLADVSRCFRELQNASADEAPFISSRSVAIALTAE